jgi:hypothetical protein
VPNPGDGPLYLASDLRSRYASAIIVYGTVREAGSNRYAAEQLQSHALDQFESRIPVYKDFEVSEGALAGHDVVFVGRPETNSALAAWASRLQLDYQAASFTLAGGPHPDEREALILAAANPLDAKRMVLVVAGNSPLATVKAVGAWPAQAQYVVAEYGRAKRSGFLPAR